MHKSTIRVLQILALLPLLGMARANPFPIPVDFLDSREGIHQAVLALDDEPSNEGAELVRLMLVDHYKPVDYLVCGTVLGPLTKKKDLEPVMWQIIIASGDWVEAHPNRVKDIDAYTLAGLESGVRVYKKILAANPKATSEIMDELVKQYDGGTLDKWNLAHPCRPE